MDPSHLSAIAETFGAVGAWVIALGGLIAWLHRRRTETISALRAEFDALKLSATSEHKLLAAQIQGISLDIASNFVRRDDLKNSIDGLHGEMTETRKDIGDLHNIIIQIYRDREGS